ncbi:actin depolymerization factor/cofilin-like domain-containing protein, partial [Streptomyces sp. NPDC006514]|uniref:actin-binding ADF family protein n=1 Tax=Streptomyces sp. NPDC006514 TaxID=3154308 RepID=UPI0033ABC19B
NSTHNSSGTSRSTIPATTASLPKPPNEMASKYVIFRLNENQTSIVVERNSSGDEDASYESFLGKLPEQDCRWAVYDFEYLNHESTPINKIAFFAWSPEGSPVKSKMVYSTFKDALRRSLDGIGVEVQGTDFNEVSHESVLEKCRQGH